MVLKMSTIVCIFVTLMLCCNILTDRQQMLDLGSQMCPYTNFCHTDARKIWPNNTKDDEKPCCFPCSCADECWELDNCCPDKDMIHTTGLRIVSCIDSYLKSRPSDINPYEGFYRVIDICPVSGDIRSNIEPKCSAQNGTTLEDFVWVSDKTGKIYQNRYCAKCNGIKESISWQIQTTCLDILTVKLENFKEVLLSRECNIINTPPEDLQSIIDKYACVKPELLNYGICNATGLMTSYDPSLEIACEQRTWPFKQGRTLIKNVFCAMCNFWSLINVDGICSYLFGKEQHESYTFFIDYTSLEAGKTGEESNCGLDEIFDKFMGLCRKLWCPVGTAPFYGRCKQLVSKMNGFVVNVQFYLDMIWNQTSLITFQEQDTIWSRIYARFIKLADINSNCEVCQKIIDMDVNSNSTLILVVTFKFNSECDYGLALAKVADMRGKVIEIHVNRTIVLTLLVRSDKQPSTVYRWYRLPTVFYYNPSNCDPKKTLSFEDITCPRLQLNYTELKLFSHTENKMKDIFISFFMGSGADQNAMGVSVCLDHYISAMSLNHAPPSNDKMSVQMLLTQLFVLSLINVNCNM